MGCSGCRKKQKVAQSDAQIKSGKMPPVPERLDNFVGAVRRVLDSGLRLVSRDEYKYREMKCIQCVHNANNFCRICGCWLWAKRALVTERCPDKPNRWAGYGKEENKKTH